MCQVIAQTEAIAQSQFIAQSELSNELLLDSDVSMHGCWHSPPN